MQSVFKIVLYLVFFCLTSGQAFAQHAAKARIRVAIDHAPPYSYVEENYQPRGLIVDILRAMQEDIDFDLVLVGCPVPRCIRMISQGQVDAMGGLIKTEKRKEFLSFVEPPYMELHSSFVFYATQQRRLQVNGYQDLYGKRIAVIRGAAYFKRFDQDEQLEKIPVLSEQVAIDLLLKDRVDLVIAVEETAEHAMSVLRQPAYKLEKLNYRFDDAIFGHLTFNHKFDQTPLARQIRVKMQEMASNGELTRLVTPYKLPPVTGLQ